jgi:hypothetical protein
MVLPPTVVGFFLLVIFGKNGPVGKILLLMGARVIFSWPATVIAASVVAFPLMHKAVRGAGDYHLLWEVSKGKWFELQGCPLPWNICLNPEKLMFFER